jgi:hypothetical protein
MTKRDWLGLLLFAIGVAIAPFGYWLNPWWTFVAAIFAVPGIVLVVFGLLRRRHATDSDELNSVDLPPGRHELRGFRGSGVLQSDVGDTHD